MEISANINSAIHELGRAGALRPSETQVQQFQDLMVNMKKGLQAGQPLQTPHNRQAIGTTPNVIEDTALRLDKAETNLKTIEKELKRSAEQMNENSRDNSEISTTITQQKLTSTSYFVYLGHLENGVSNFTEELDSLTKRR